MNPTGLFMTISPKFRIFPILCVFLTSVTSAWGVPTFSINGGGTTYTIQGVGLENVGALHLTIGYEKTALANPRVTVQNLFSGAMMVPNTKQIGVIRIAVLSTAQRGVSGTGGIATVVFDQVGSNYSPITGFTVEAVSASSVDLESQASLGAISGTSAPTDTASAATSSPASTPATTTPVPETTAAVTLPPVTVAAPPTQTTPVATAPVATPATTPQTTATTTASATESASTVQTAVASTAPVATPTATPQVTASTTATPVSTATASTAATTPATTTQTAATAVPATTATATGSATTAQTAPTPATTAQAAATAVPATTAAATAATTTTAAGSTAVTTPQVAAATVTATASSLSGSATATSRTGVTLSAPEGGVAGLTSPVPATRAATQGEELKGVDELQPPSLPGAASRTESPAARPATAAVKKVTEYRSVLSLFKEFTGPRNPNTLLALFKQAAYPGVSQSPAIALSDGVQKLTLSFEPATPFATAPNFVINGGTLISLKKKQGSYLLEVLPETKSSEASVKIVTQEITIVIPLTVAPPLDPRFISSGKLDAASFALFLQEKSPAKGDVNNDGLKSYLDEYIYAANCLVRTQPVAPTVVQKERKTS